MTDDNIKKIEIKEPSSIEKFGKIGMNVGEKLGKAVTEFFTGKPPSEEEKKRRARLKILKEAQEEAEFENNLELARRGQYVVPEQKKVKKQDNMFSNLGKYNPLEDFNKSKFLGSKNPMDRR